MSSNSLNATTNKPICDYYHGSAIFGVESVVLLILAFGSQVLNYVLLQGLLNCGGHLPLNTKLLLINCTIAAMIKSAYFVLRSVYNFCLLHYGFGEMALARTVCGTVEALYAVPTFALLLSMIFIGFERFWSTWKKNLSQIETVGWQVISAITIIWVTGAIIYIIEVTIVDVLIKPITCYCYYPMILAPDGSVLNNSTIIGTQTLNMIIYFFVYWKNKRLLFEFTLNTARHSLSERFIMWANVKATKMLIPASVVHALSYDAVVALLYFTNKRLVILSPDDYLALVVFSHCVLCLDILLHPILCLRNNAPLKQIVKNWYPKISCFIERSTPVDRSLDDALYECGKDAVHFKKNSIHSPNYRPATGIKSIVEYRVNPEHHQDILNQVWDLSGRRNLKTNVIKPMKQAKRIP